MVVIGDCGQHDFLCYDEYFPSVWLSVDPLAHKYPSLSPFNFVANNPLMLVDPDGRKILNAHDQEVSDAESNLASKNSKWGQWWAQNRLDGANRRQARANNAISELALNDQELYDQLDCMTIADRNGTEGDVNIYVHATGRSEGPGGARQEGDTQYCKVAQDGSHPRGNFNGQQINLPLRKSNFREVGFDKNLYGPESFQDITLANEFGDVLFFMHHNEEATIEGGDGRHYEPGGGGYDAYLESPSGIYSFEIQEEYKQKRN